MICAVLLAAPSMRMGAADVKASKVTAATELIAAQIPEYQLKHTIVLTCCADCCSIQQALQVNFPARKVILAWHNDLTQIFARSVARSIGRRTRTNMRDL